MDEPDISSLSTRFATSDLDPGCCGCSTFDSRGSQFGGGSQFTAEA